MSELKSVSGSSGANTIEFSTTKSQTTIKIIPEEHIFFTPTNEPIYFKNRSWWDKITDGGYILFLIDFPFFWNYLENLIPPIIIPEPISKITTIYIIFMLFIVMIAIGYFTHHKIIVYINKVRMNHGAEHMVIQAYKHHDLENVKKYSRFALRCGGNIIIPLFLIFGLSELLIIPGTIAFIFLWIWGRVYIIRKIVFIMFGRWIQYLTTKQPTDEILYKAKSTLEVLIKNDG